MHCVFVGEYNKPEGKCVSLCGQENSSPDDRWMLVNLKHYHEHLGYHEIATLASLVTIFSFYLNC